MPAAKVITVKTDENGRAEFSGVAAGTTVKAVATVDGERLESQEFPWPGDGGIRLMLVATAKGGDAPPPVFQPQPGNVVFGDQTRVIIDHADDALQVYYLLDIQNTARAPVNPPSAVVINMPTGALSATVLAGAPQAVALGDHVTITGPFAPGQTEVQIAFRLPVDERRRDVRAEAAAGGSGPRGADEESRRHFADVAAAAGRAGARDSRASATSLRRARRFRPARRSR